MSCLNIETAIMPKVRGAKDPSSAPECRVGQKEQGGDRGPDTSPGLDTPGPDHRQEWGEEGGLPARTLEPSVRRGGAAARCRHVGFVAGRTCLQILVMSLKARHTARFPQPVCKGRLTTAEDAGILEAFVSLFPLPGAFPQDICMGCSFTPFRSFLICEGGHPDHLA